MRIVVRGWRIVFGEIGLKDNKIYDLWEDLASRLAYFGSKVIVVIVIMSSCY
jgi:hypothetical protein